MIQIACVFTFLQGIKFYDPEIVENTPEAVEYRGLQNVLDAVAEHLGYAEGKVGFFHLCSCVCKHSRYIVACLQGMCVCARF